VFGLLSNEVLIDRSNGHLSATLSKARKLCENFRSGTASASTTPSPGEGPAGAGGAQAQQGRLLRWFSMRRGSNHYEVETGTALTASGPGGAGAGAGCGAAMAATMDRKMPLLPEVSEAEADCTSDSAPLISCEGGVDSASRDRASKVSTAAPHHAPHHAPRQTLPVLWNGMARHLHAVENTSPLGRTCIQTLTPLW